jgi:hypothetical protein
MKNGSRLPRSSAPVVSSDFFFKRSFFFTLLYSSLKFCTLFLARPHFQASPYFLSLSTHHKKNLPVRASLPSLILSKNNSEHL